MAQRSGQFIHRPAGLPQEEIDRVQDRWTDGCARQDLALKTELLLIVRKHDRQVEKKQTNKTRFPAKLKFIKED